MSNIKRYSPTTIGDSDDRQFMGMFEFDDGKYCAYEDVDAALAAKEARIAELEGVLAKALSFTEANTFGGTDALALIEECHAALASKQQAEPATHSEDGREVRARKTWKAGNPSWKCANCNTPIMQHENQTFCPEGPAFASNSTSAQPALQVGGDERETAIAQFALTLPMTSESAAGGNTYDQELRRYYLLGWDDRAALAPVASQVGGDDDYLHGHPRHEHDSRDEIELFLRDAYAAGANAAHSRSLTTALDYAARHAPKLRAALSPAAVVMPDRRAEDYPSPRTRDAWNDALDAVARLNRRAIPEELLERVASPWMDDEELTINRHVAINELRALLGKEVE